MQVVMHDEECLASGDCECPVIDLSLDLSITTELRAGAA